MAILEIKHLLTGSVLFSLECGSLKLCVEAAIKSGANLYGANLTRANLYGANLTRANLDGANLNGANLNGANLTRANLNGANLNGANLNGANLYGANLYGANLNGANLNGANLNGANLNGANLYGASLNGANLDGANLTRGNNFDKASSCNFQIFDGDLIGWKKLHGNIIAKLLIPADAKRTGTPIGRKCRAEFVKTLELQHPDGTVLNTTSQRGTYKHDTIYTVGEITRPDSYDPTPLKECTNGIHFFATRAEAVAYA